MKEHNWTGFGILDSNWDFASPKCKHSKDKIVVHMKQNMTFFIFYKSKLLHWTMYVTNYNSFETPIVGSKIRGYQVATILDRLICHFYFVTHRFYGKSNLAILGDKKLQFCSFWKSWILVFGKIPQLKVLQIPKFSL